MWRQVGCLPVFPLRVGCVSRRAAAMPIFDGEKKTSLSGRAAVQAWLKGVRSFLGLQGMLNCIYESDWLCSLVIHKQKIGFVQHHDFEIDIL
jgi:hypothetical protein